MILKFVAVRDRIVVTCTDTFCANLHELVRVNWIRDLLAEDRSCGDDDSTVAINHCDN